MNMYNNTTPMGGYSSFLPLSGAVTETVLPSSVFNNHSLGNAVKSESGVTYNNNNNHHHHHINNVVMTPTSRKRSRDNSNNYGYNNNINNDSFSFLGQDVSLQIQQQQLDIEHLIMQRVSLVHSFVVFKYRWCCGFVTFVDITNKCVRSLNCGRRELKNLDFATVF